MNRENTLLEVARVCRGSHRATLWALGYLAVGLKPEELQNLLEGCQEVAKHDAAQYRDHLAAYRERWGRLPSGS